jgi:hypothetical protein
MSPQQALDELDAVESGHGIVDNEAAARRQVLLGKLWRRSTPTFFARRTSRSRAVRISLASVGRAIAFSYTVASTMTRVKSAGLASSATS